MKFCRNCGTTLPTGAPSPAPMGMPPPGAFPQPGAFPTPPPAYQPPPSQPPIGVLPTMPTGGLPPGVPAPAGVPAMVTCPRCSTATPAAFPFCQQCGLHLQAMQPTDPAQQRPRTPSGSPILSDPMTPSPLAASMGSGQPPVVSFSPPAPQQPDAFLGTLAADPPRAATVPQSRQDAAMGATGWGTAILVNRDGSDGQRFPLGGEYLVVGRAGADIAFDDDRFLARQHARFERGNDGRISVLPLDTLNGVFRKTDAPVELTDGTIVLVGREVLRYEKLDAEEAKVHPLVRHGVALFGSPPREPWGRLVQLVPSGGARDVRHLVGEEVVLGREEGDIVFRDDAFLSRRHAALNWDGRRVLLTDLGSSNGTFVRVMGRTTVKHGDHVRMGDQLLRIELAR